MAPTKKIVALKSPAKGYRKISNHPVTYRQAQILNCLSDPSCTNNFRNHWLFAHAIIVRPRVDRRRLQRAARMVFERHDSLRIRFERSGHVWRAVISDLSEYSIKDIDLASEKFADDASFKACIRAIARKPLDALNEKLAEIVHVRCGERGDVIVFRVHHTVADGYGMVLLTEDMFNGLIGQPCLGRAISHGEFVMRWELPTGAEAKTNEAYWTNTLNEFPSAPNIGRKAKGLEPNWHNVGWRDNRRLSVFASKASRKDLSKRASELNLTNDIILFTAHAQALCERYDVERIAHATLCARPEPKLTQFCGYRATRLQFIHNAFDRQSDFEAAAKAKRKELLTGMEHLPSEILEHRSPFQLQLIEKGCHPNQFVTTTPFATTLAQRSRFREAFFLDFETERQLGPITLLRIDVDNHTGDSSELALRIAAPTDSSIFNISYDIDAYSRDELVALGKAVCRISGLDLKELVFN